MNLSELFSPGLLGIIFIILFIGLMTGFAFARRSQPVRFLRTIPAFSRLARAIGLAVEAGSRLHVSLGRGELNGVEGGAALIGLTVLQRIARVASASDRPPVATSGTGTLTVLSQDTLRSTYHRMGAADQYEPTSGQLTGLTPFSYAAGVLPVIQDQQVSATFLAGHLGSEAALIADAGERSGSLTLAGSDQIQGQAVLYATAQELLIGEELFAAGAYMQAGPMHFASLRAQDVMRWVLIIVILAGLIAKAAGVL